MSRSAVSPWPVRIEYCLALDIAGAVLARVTRRGDPLLLAASAPPFVEEVLARASGPVAVLPDSIAVVEAARSLASSGGLPDDVTVDVVRAMDPLSHVGAPFRAAIWASPQRVAWRRRLETIDAVLADGAVLAVLTAGMGGWLASRLRRRWTPGEPRWAGGGLRKALAQLGYRQVYAADLAGPRDMLYAIVGRLADLIARPDLLDRCEAGRRLALADGTHRGLAQFRLLVARKAGSA